MSRRSLDGDAVHVYRFRLDPETVDLGQLELILSKDELDRADRFRGNGLRRRYVVGRASLRSILGDYLETCPDQVRFSYGPRGKPRLTDSATSLEFNLAHTADDALLAITLGRTLGVDLERIRPMPDAEGIINRFFTENEVADFRQHSEAERPHAFFRGWTRKEAYLKATGDGLALSLQSFEVSMGLSDRPLLSINDDPAAALPWTMRDIDLGPEFAASLAVLGSVGDLVTSEWSLNLR